jgi:hypothetical protein
MRRNRELSRLVVARRRQVVIRTRPVVIVVVIGLKGLTMQAG